MMLLLELFVPSLKVILDLKKQSPLFLVLGYLLRNRFVIVMTLPIDGHKLIQ
jgi:hypothetical protein